jgi:hypothetical protein
MIIAEIKHLVHYFGRQKENASFFNDYFQVTQKVFPHCRWPYVYDKVFYTSEKKKFKPYLRTISEF